MDPYTKDRALDVFFWTCVGLAVVCIVLLSISVIGSF